MEIPPAVRAGLEVVRTTVSRCKAAGSQEDAFVGLVSGLEAMMAVSETMAQHAHMNQVRLEAALVHLEGTVKDLKESGGGRGYPRSMVENRAVGGLKVLVDDKSGTLFAHPSPDKAIITGEHSEYMINKVVEDIDSLGCGKVTMMTDKEIAMTSLQAKVQRRRDKPVIPQNAFKGDSQSNGLADKAVRDIEEAVRL